MQSTRSSLKQLRERLQIQIDCKACVSVSIDHAPGGMYGCCNEPSEWTFTVWGDTGQGSMTLDKIRWSRGSFTSETDWLAQPRQMENWMKARSRAV